MTVKEAINGFLEMVSERQGKISQDTQWSYRLIYSYLLQFRARILSERKNKKQQHSRHNIQTIPCISLEKVDMNECPCIPASGCIFLKSKYPIPRAATNNYISVTSILGNKTYDYIRWENFDDMINSKNKVERTKPYYTIKSFGKESHLYIYSDNDKEIVSATLIAENPLEVIGYPNCGKEVNICNPMDELFIIDMDTLQLIYGMMFDMLLKVKQTTTPEIYNNQEPDIAKAP